VRLLGTEEEILSGFRKSRGLYGYGLPQVYREPELRRTHRLRAAGDGIVFTDLDPALPLVVTGESASGELELCGAQLSGREQIERITDSRLWLAVSVDSVAEFRGDTTPLPRPPEPCGSGAAYFGRFERSGGDGARFPAVLILPIVDRYAVYVDEKTRLRRHSLVTGENQPVALGIQPLKISTVKDQGAVRYRLELSAVHLPAAIELQFALPDDAGGRPYSLLRSFIPAESAHGVSI
jgi:hypothetical protein